MRQAQNRQASIAELTCGISNDVPLQKTIRLDRKKEPVTTKNIDRKTSKFWGIGSLGTFLQYVLTTIFPNFHSFFTVKHCHKGSNITDTAIFHTDVLRAEMDEKIIAFLEQKLELFYNTHCTWLMMQNVKLFGCEQNGYPRFENHI